MLKYVLGRDGAPFQPAGHEYIYVSKIQTIQVSDFHQVTESRRTRTLWVLDHLLVLAQTAWKRRQPRCAALQVPCMHEQAKFRQIWLPDCRAFQGWYRKGKI
jgi:hypothetical protein